MSVRRIASLLVSTFFLVSVDLSAHHGAALYDPTETVSLTGPVTSFRFVFPHTLVSIAVPSDDGSTVEWSGELTTPNRLARGIGPGGTRHNAVWTRDLLQPGDIIELTGNPARNGAPSLRLLRIVNADGIALVGGAAADAIARGESNDVSAEPPVAEGADLSGM